MPPPKKKPSLQMREYRETKNDTMFEQINYRKEEKKIINYSKMVEHLFGFVAIEEKKVTAQISFIFLQLTLFSR